MASSWNTCLGAKPAGRSDAAGPDWTASTGAAEHRLGCSCTGGRRGWHRSRSRCIHQPFLGSCVMDGGLDLFSSALNDNQLFIWDNRRNFGAPLRPHLQSPCCPRSTPCFFRARTACENEKHGRHTPRSLLAHLHLSLTLFSIHLVPPALSALLLLLPRLLHFTSPHLTAPSIQARMN
jgi:hypothetical protein